MAEDRDKLDKLGKQGDELEPEEDDVEAHKWDHRGKLDAADTDREQFGEDGERSRLY